MHTQDDIEELRAQLAEARAQLASEQSRVLGDADLLHEIRCPHCKQSGQARMKVPTLWQVAPGLAVVYQQLAEVREAAQACVGEHWPPTVEAIGKLEAVLSRLVKVGP